jgi:uncharacterized protein YnzC (UPF0291/DUF896 family)
MAISIQNKIENKMIKDVDSIAQLQEFRNNSCIKTKITPHEIKSLTNRRRNLFSKIKKRFNKTIKDKIKLIDTKINIFFNVRKSNEVRRSIIL